MSEPNETTAAPMLSIGLPSTLENWVKLSSAMYGPNSEATKWLQEKMDEQGPQEPVIADERQTIILLTSLHLGTENKGEEGQELSRKDGADEGPRS